MQFESHNQGHRVHLFWYDKKDSSHGRHMWKMLAVPLVLWISCERRSNTTKYKFDL